LITKDFLDVRFSFGAVACRPWTLDAGGLVVVRFSFNAGSLMGLWRDGLYLDVGFLESDFDLFAEIARLGPEKV
jgi:hypothetical protein